MRFMVHNQVLNESSKTLQLLTRAAMPIDPTKPIALDLDVSPTRSFMQRCLGLLHSGVHICFAFYEHLHCTKFALPCGLVQRSVPKGKDRRENMKD